MPLSSRHGPRRLAARLQQGNAIPASRGKGSASLLLVLRAAVMSMAMPPACQARLGYAQVNALGRKAQAGNKPAWVELRIAAERGNPDAQAWMGAFCQHGRVVPRDEAMALYWTRQSAEPGDDEAAAWTADYVNGIDVPRHWTKGIRCSSVPPMTGTRRRRPSWATGT